LEIVIADRPKVAHFTLRRASGRPLAVEQPAQVFARPAQQRHHGAERDAEHGAGALVGQALDPDWSVGVGSSCSLCSSMAPRRRSRRFPPM
jgi:hypothetical protein